jgi:hypothetical protein
MQDPDAQPATPSPAESQAESQTGSQDGRYRGAIYRERRLRFRTYGVPIRVTGRHAHAVERSAQPPGVRLLRRFAGAAFINRNFALLCGSPHFSHATSRGRRWR